jgi:hypothetical protein
MNIYSLQRYTLVFQLYVNQYGLVVKNIIFNKQGYKFFAGASSGGALDPTMVLPSPGGSARVYGYWLQPNVDGRPGLLFPGY